MQGREIMQVQRGGRGNETDVFASASPVSLEKDWENRWCKWIEQGPGKVEPWSHGNSAFYFDYYTKVQDGFRKDGDIVYSLYFLCSHY